MKKLFFLLLFIPSICFAGSAQISDIANASTKTADGVVIASDGYFKGFIITPDGTNDVSIVFYDNASAASGTKLTPTMTFAGSGGTQGITFPAYIICKNGIYADVTTVGTVEYTTYYRDK